VVENIVDEGTKGHCAVLGMFVRRMRRTDVWISWEEIVEIGEAQCAIDTSDEVSLKGSNKRHSQLVSRKVTQSTLGTLPVGTWGGSMDQIGMGREDLRLRRSKSWVFRAVDFKMIYYTSKQNVVQATKSACWK